ncbi:MAG TPA: tetratricopeptide repeat protein, partial [Burkholderiaceae bacterium]|nr:tetratricopeptide repeat protein [Burkholderiaceae bacterium]
MWALQMRTAAVFVAAGLFLGGCATPPMDPASAVFRTGSMEEMARLMREAQAQAQARPQAERRAGCETQAQQRLSERQRAEPDQVDADLLSEAIAGCRKAGDRNGERLLLEWLGHMHFMQGQYAAAAETYRRVFPLADELFDKVSAWEALGRAQLAAGDFAQALLSYRTAFDVAASAPEPDTWLQVQALRGQGLVHLAQRDFAQASRVLERAFALTKEEGDDRTLAGPLLSSLGLAQLRAGQTQAAEASLRQALEVPESTSAELRRAQAQMPEIPPALQPLLAATRPMLQDWMPHATALMVDGYACSLLQDLLVAQQRHGEALETSERCRGRALVQRLAVRALPEEAQAPTLVQLRAIARAQKATIVEYTVVYEPALLP